MTIQEEREEMRARFPKGAKAEMKGRSYTVRGVRRNPHGSWQVLCVNQEGLTIALRAGALRIEKARPERMEFQI